MDIGGYKGLERWYPCYGYWCAARKYGYTPGWIRKYSYSETKYRVTEIYIGALGMEDIRKPTHILFTYKTYDIHLSGFWIDCHMVCSLAKDDLDIGLHFSPVVISFFYMSRSLLKWRHDICLITAKIDFMSAVMVNKVNI